MNPKKAIATIKTGFSNNRLIILLLHDALFTGIAGLWYLRIQCGAGRDSRKTRSLEGFYRRASVDVVEDGRESCP
jgi:hypothetical protein